MELADMHAYGLNPFEIRAGQKLKGTYHERNHHRLNPFEIRAGQKRKTCKTCRTSIRLNPFEIRAGQKQCANAHRCEHGVLIPLKSGQARNPRARRMAAVVRS